MLIPECIEERDKRRYFVKNLVPDPSSNRVVSTHYLQIYHYYNTYYKI